MQSSEAGSSLDLQLRLEGWSLHQRLSWAVAHGLPAQDRVPHHDALENWRQVVAPDHAANFDKRLSWDGLTPEVAAWALQPDASSCPQDPPWWPLLTSLRQAASDGLHHQGLTQRCRSKPFVHIWRPASAWALQTLQARCVDLQPQLQLVDRAWLDLAAALLERLCTVADQALWEQFNQRRTAGQMLLAHLGTNGDGTGEPVHEAYDAFVAEQLSSGYGLLLAEFPVLGRLLAVITERWLEGSEEMLRRLVANKSELHQHFGIDTNMVLHEVQLGLSDPHRGGRTVAILSCGNRQGDDISKIVYKPKDMQVDHTYQAFLQTLNDASTLPPLRPLTILSSDGYGFMEWVEHLPCKSEEELARFYANAGRTMAVLHLLGCTDCHYENLIANGDQLILIDTETLLEAEPSDLINHDNLDLDAISELQRSIQGSVLRSGLLPQWLMAGAGRKLAFDISALGIQPPPPELESPGWIGLNSDGMMKGRCSQPCELPTSLPVGLGSPQRLTDFIDELCAGFAAQLQEAIRLKPILMRSLDDFSGQLRRLVARATRLYFIIQRQMLEPSNLRNAVAHGLKLEQLSRSYVLANEKPLNWPMFEAERLQMEQLDIPFFEHPIDGEELPLPEGLPSIPEFMKASGLSAAHRRLEQLNQSEIDFQQQLIRGAIAARHMQTNKTPGSKLESRTGAAKGPEAPVVESDVYRQEAFRLGQELWDAAIRDTKGRPEWLGMDLGADGESFHFGLIGSSLYSGGSGIALLFARLAQTSAGDQANQWRKRAWSCFESLAEWAERNSNDQLFRLMRDLPCGLSGSGGILLALQLLCSSGLPDAGLLADLLMAQLRPERLLADEGIDVITGVAGLIGPLLQARTPRAQELAATCGERLLALQLDNGGWSASQRKAPLTGFSHGAAGIAAALAQLAQVSGDERFRDGANRALAYERSVFHVERGNWPDFRSSSEPSEFMISWCHGAPGILLSRRLLQTAGLSDQRILHELEVARETTQDALAKALKHENNSASHLCCGVLGLTSLLRIDALLSDREVAPLVTAAESMLIQQARGGDNYIFLSVDTGSINLPGLFTGKAGVALALLEAADGLLALPAVLSAGIMNTSTTRP